jgi:hypothetical protein
LPEYQKNEVDAIAVSINEVFEASKKEPSFENMPEDQWYELSVMSRIVYEHILALHDKISKQRK